MVMTMTNKGGGVARDWLKENPNGFQEVYKMVPIATPQSHHVLLWYYK